MAGEPTNPPPAPAERPARSLADLPPDELARYGNELGLDLTPQMPIGEMTRLVRQRQELLLQLDHDAMLDVVVWARRPVRKSASKEALAREIAQVRASRFDGLSARGLRALAALRGLHVHPGDDDEMLRRKLAHTGSFWERLRQTRRAVVGAVLANLIEGRHGDSEQAYHFLPEDETSRKVSIRAEIEDRGLMGGLASRLRGVADDYVREKLDEIEARIDRKLDEIDHRLGEWRDREIANRLKIIKITLAASVLFAVLSLGYHLVRRSVGGESNAVRPAAVEPSAPQPAER